MAKGGMTKLELEAAQFLLHVYERSQGFADKLDPKRERRHEVAAQLDALTGPARMAFFYLVGRQPGRVQLWELSTVNPAAWTQEPQTLEFER
jgi:hypothetical protein